MKEAQLVALVTQRPQEIWDILREAAYFHSTGVCSETFEQHSVALFMFGQHDAQLEG